MNYSKQSLQFQIGQIGDSEKRILKYGKQLTSFELQRSSCFLKKPPSNHCTISPDGEKGFLFCHCDRPFLFLGIKKTADCTHTARVNGQFSVFGFCAQPDKLEFFFFIRPKRHKACP